MLKFLFFVSIHANNGLVVRAVTITQCKDYRKYRAQYDYFHPCILQDESLSDEAKKAQEISELLKEKEKLLEVNNP